MIVSPRISRELLQGVLTEKDEMNAQQTKPKDVYYLLTR